MHQDRCQLPHNFTSSAPTLFQNGVISLLKSGPSILLSEVLLAVYKLHPSAHEQTDPVKKHHDTEFAADQQSNCRNAHCGAQRTKSFKCWFQCSSLFWIRNISRKKGHLKMHFVFLKKIVRPEEILARAHISDKRQPQNGLAWLPEFFTHKLIRCARQTLSENRKEPSWTTQRQSLIGSCPIGGQWSQCMLFRWEY